MTESQLDAAGWDGGLFRQAINGLTDQAFVLIDDVRCVRFWSSGAETLFGRSAVDTVGVRLDRVFGVDKQCWDLPVDQDSGSADIQLSKRCWFALPDGTRRHLITSATQLRDRSGCIGFALHAHDVRVGELSPDDLAHATAPGGQRASGMSAQLREMETQLDAERAERARLDGWRIEQLRGLVASQEDERGRIARELREGIGQQLTALQLSVEALGQEPSGPRGIANALEMLADIGRGIDAIAWELRPAALDGLGLSAVLRSYLHQWSRHTAVRGTFHSGVVDDERFPLEVEATLYRIARAALDTVAQAAASSVDVLLERRDAHAILVVEDDAVAAPSGRDPIVLGDIRQRALALGGTVEVEPAPAGGTSIRARVPLTPPPPPRPMEWSQPTTQGALADSPGSEITAAAVNRLRARLAQLRHAVAARDEFVATVAHELRNPVAPLIFQIRLAIERTEQLAKANEDLPHDWVQGQFRRVEQRLHRLLETLDRLLDVSRLSTGRIDLQPELIDLVRAVREIANSFEAELLVAQCSLTVDVRSTPTGLWDRVRLEQICRNLISNAVRFGAGGPIEVSIDGDSDFAILQVRDHGVGIAPDQQARIFERFERGSEQRSGGFGVGLWIVKNICTAMGGTIAVESTVGEGARFTVMLPRHAVASTDRPHADGLLHDTQ